VPRVILFREEHSPRVFVEKVDFVSAAGASPPGLHRPGGPYALLTSLALFRFDKLRRRFVLTSIAPGHGTDEVRARTGFAFDVAPEVGPTPEPPAATLALLRGRILDELSEAYPQFAQTLTGEWRMANSE
jgi:glutaconate CoA-transferase subunit B